MTKQERLEAADRLVDELRAELHQLITDDRPEDASCWELYDELLRVISRLDQIPYDERWRYMLTAMDIAGRMAVVSILFKAECFGEPFRTVDGP